MSGEKLDHRRAIEVGAEPVTLQDPSRFSHLAQNRGLIVRRALLASALSGLVPVPIMDDILSGRVRAGLYVKLATSRQVDLPAASAEVLAEGKAGSAWRTITFAAAALATLKLAWRKLFALLAAGRGAEDMATIFQVATLIDHYCARLHVGGPISRSEAALLRALVTQSVKRTSKTKLVPAFREGGKILGRSLVEAPRWVSLSLSRYAERWLHTSGHPEAAPAGWPTDDSEEEKTWLDRAAHTVDERLAALGSEYLGDLIDDFEARWRERALCGEKG
jgi:hypothetical protein